MSGSLRSPGAWLLAVLVILALGTAAASAQDEEPQPPAPAPAPPSAEELPRLRPPPVVRIVGVTTRRGARITRLTIRAPVGSTIVSTCVARNMSLCPYPKRVTVVAGLTGQSPTTHLYAFERSFRAGVLLQLYVVKVGRTGKYTSFDIRRSKQPLRQDRCLAGFSLMPVSCPGS